MSKDDSTKRSNAPAPNAAIPLRLDWCSYEAARFAVTNWHYSRSLPTPPLVRVGVWEDGKYIGCVLFSRGATPNIGKPYGLSATEVCELTRVALAIGHKTPVSKIIAVAIRMLRQNSAGLRLIVSFADPEHGHHGGVYQAGNWIYSGASSASTSYIDQMGRKWHGRQVSSTGVKRQYGTVRRVPKISDCEHIKSAGKHRYLFPLDAEMKAKIAPLAKPYPKRAGSSDSAAAANHAAEGGVSPTSALQFQNNGTTN